MPGGLRPLTEKLKTKNENRINLTIVFSYVTEHCASFIPIGPHLRREGLYVVNWYRAKTENCWLIVHVPCNFSWIRYVFLSQVHVTWPQSLKINCEFCYLALKNILVICSTSDLWSLDEQQYTLNFWRTNPYIYIWICPSEIRCILLKDCSSSDHEYDLEIIFRLNLNLSPSTHRNGFVLHIKLNGMWNSSTIFLLLCTQPNLMVFPR